jgi:Tfp pilus assembly protein PilN
MKFPINLATQPFHKDRPILFASGVVAALMVCSLILLASLAVADRRRSADTRAVIARLDRQIAQATANQARLDAVLRRPENAEVMERSLFLNELLFRKGISWTRVFADLEKTLPPNVRLSMIRPQVLSESQIHLEMMLAAESALAVTDALRALESSEVFGETNVHNIATPSPSDPLYRYRVSVTYAQKL